MYKSDAEHIIRRVMEETEAQFDEKQIEALAQIIIKVTEQIVEEHMTIHLQSHRHN
jgi:hypothetical protein